MGICVSLLRVMQLTAYKYDLEYNIQTLAQSKMELAQSVTELLNIGTDLDANNPLVKQLEYRKARLNELEKKLELKMENYKKRLSAVDQELQSVKGMLDKNMQSAFSYK